MLSEQEFAELVSYVSSNVDHDLDRWAHRVMGNREPMPYQLADPINEFAAEWCSDNNIDPDEYSADYEAEDVFYHDNYEFDK